MNTLVSVCIPVYNGEPFIIETIKMVLDQDYDNMEILISDNTSSDHTVDKIREIQDARVQLYQNDHNLGMGGNWNVLLDKAKGDYIIIVCADDFLLPGAIREKAKVLDENPDVSIVFSSAYVMDENGKKIFTRSKYGRDKKIEGKKIQRELFCKKNFFCEPINNMFRASAAREVGYFDTSLWYTIDWDYWLRILNYGNAYFLKRAYSGFRVSTVSATGTNLKGTEKILADEEVFLRKYQSGEIMEVSPFMIKRRRRNVYFRLQLKILFMKLGKLL